MTQCEVGQQAKRDEVRQRMRRGSAKWMRKGVEKWIVEDGGLERRISTREGSWKGPEHTTRSIQGLKKGKRRPDAGEKGGRYNALDLLRRSAARHSGNSWKTSEWRSSHPPVERRGWNHGNSAAMYRFAASGTWVTVAISCEPMGGRVGRWAQEARWQTTASRQTGKRGNGSGDGR